MYTFDKKKWTLQIIKEKEKSC